MTTRITIITIMIAINVMASFQYAHGQSQTTGTLNLRNTQPATISLTLPTTGVTAYTLLLPPTPGSAGQALTIQGVTGSTASLSWTNSAFWKLDGTLITAGGTAVNEQYLGTSNAQDLVFASNGLEALRVIGVAGPRQGFIGIGTTTPSAPVDIAKNVLLSNNGTSTELRFAEPSAGGTNFSSFRAGSQAADISYTLPADPATTDGMVLASSTGGTLSWMSPFQNSPRGIFTPVVGNYIHVIAAGANIMPGTIPIISMMNPPGTTVGISVTAIDAANDTITVETSVPLGATDRIAWIMIQPF